MSFSLQQIAVQSAVNAGLCGFTGFALGANPLPYAVAGGLNAVIKSVMHNYLQTTPLKCDFKARYEVNCLHAFVENGGSAVLTLAIMYKLGLATLASSNAFLAAGSLAVACLATYWKATTIDDPIKKNTYVIFPYPAAVLGGAAGGVFLANVFGWNPVALGAVSAVASLMGNTNYKLFGCIDRKIHRVAGEVVKGLTSTVFAVSILKKNLIGAVGSVAFTALCAYLTSREKAPASVS